MKTVNKAFPKKDSQALVTGQPVYTEDLAPEGCLCVRILRSPHAHARIVGIDTEKAMKLPGVVGVYTYRDVPNQRFTIAGQTYPEFSPYDRLILENKVRFVGDAVAIVAAETAEAAEAALAAVRVDYEVLPAVLDAREAVDNAVVIHDESDWSALVDTGGDPARNLCTHGSEGAGDPDAVLASCPVTLERTYHTKANQQTMMETFRTFTEMDCYGRLNVTSSTQVPFHVRRILSRALGIPKSDIRVIKPRIGGGFGAKQTAVCEMYPAFVTLKTGRPALLVYTREESMIASSPRHEMIITVRIGAETDGTIRAMTVYTLSNTGAYGDHGPTTVGLSGHKTISLYRIPDFRFSYDVVYTNRMAAGAYRGYGATQGTFAVESAINELAAQLKIDPGRLREINMVRQGDVMPAYYGERTDSCALDRCLDRVREMIGWHPGELRRVMPDGKVRGIGLAMAMQGSGISGVDVGSASISLCDGGFYMLRIGATDMGTGCDTILSQIAAEALDTSFERIAVRGVDTDSSPYDSGSYASSTTYVTGMAVVRAAQQLREKMSSFAAQVLHTDAPLVLEGDRFCYEDGREAIALSALADASMCGNRVELSATVSHSSPTSPPPFMAGAAEVEVDPETGGCRVVRYAAAVDCGTVINPALARVQVEGGIVQGIGMTLYENVTYGSRGLPRERSLMQYRIPTRLDVGEIAVEFVSSYEPSGPYGAKSIGEIVINTPAPAIAEAICQATGKRFRELPVMPQHILMEEGK